MCEMSDDPAPVGVVPRRQARSIEPLMSDVPDAAETRTVVGGVNESPPGSADWARWLPSMAVFTAVAGALEWLKLTR